MSYDIDTPKGMANSIAWTQRLIDSLNDGGAWAIPRSGTVVSIDKTNKVATITSFLPDPSVRRVLQEMGYSIKEKSL